jgi:RHS repeat-associated protein
MPEDIFLELQLDVNSYTATDTLGTVKEVYGTYMPADNTLLLTWEWMPGAERYELEWLFVDNPLRAETLPYDFLNAARISTSGSWYAIPLAYSRGNILYRVRAVGIYRYWGLYPVYSSWSYASSRGTKLPAPGHPEYRFDWEGLEDSLAWQYSALYAEKGKRKEVITFYDGTLRNRQQVTLANSDQTAIVGESFYDHIGRPALQAIPAPAPGRGIRYYGTRGASTGLFNSWYPKSQYDFDYTLTHAQPFMTDAGSALYYSAQNPFLAQPHRVNTPWLPQDSGYTYAHTRYVNDGTDRPHSQSTPGTGFALGRGHDTHYYYGIPMQQELDRLFGNEAGYASHYQKTVAVDANGVISVAYYDSRERLIASGIAGGGDNLLPVDSTPAPADIRENIRFDDESRQYSRGISVTAPATYIFYYQLDAANCLADYCAGRSGCIDCRYKIVFSLWNPDLLQYIFMDTVILSSDQTITRTVTLLPGNYMLYKSMQLVTDEWTDAQMEAYAARQRPCIVYPRADIARCYTPCQEHCMAEFGLLYPDSSNADYMRCVAVCENPPQNANTQCEAYLMGLSNDMSPGGQYFDNIRSHCPGDTGTLPAQDINRYLNTICQDRFLMDSDLIAIANSFYITPPYGSSLWDSMRMHWKPWYAEVMLKYHPEHPLYRLLCNCGRNADKQRYYDSLMLNTNSSDTAKMLGLWNPVDLPYNYYAHITDTPYEGYQPFSSGFLDPFFVTDSFCCPRSAPLIMRAAIEAMLGYMGWKTDTNHYISLWYLLFDPDNIAGGGSVPFSNEIKESIVAIQQNVIPQWAEQYQCTREDARWRLFKSIYTYLKERIKYTILLPICGYYECNTPSFEWGQKDWWQPQYPASALEHCSLFLKADTACRSIALTTAGLERQGGFQIRFLCNPAYGINADNIDSLANTTLNEMYNDCVADCEAYSHSWMDELTDYFQSHCPHMLTDSVTRENMRMKMVDICHEKCDSCALTRDFSIKQMLNLNEYKNILAAFCGIDPDNYTRIVYPKPDGYYVDCGCNNYQSLLNSDSLTFWSRAKDIVNLLAQEGITADTLQVKEWNWLCIWMRYDMLIDRKNDSTILNDMKFPVQLKCPQPVDPFTLCRQQAIRDAAAADTASFYAAWDSTVAARRAFYPGYCMDNMSEQLTISCRNDEFLYTLYYYDQAGNLIRTVPPKGVNVISNGTVLDRVVDYRKNVARYDTIQPGFVWPGHNMVTGYRYNTLNQLIQSRMPDHDSTTVIFYDILSRPVLSQNSKQRPSYEYSYTLYDNIGRITESGKLRNSSAFSRADAADPVRLAAFINGGTRTELTRTFYDNPLRADMKQTGLRNRIAAVTYSDSYSYNPLTYTTASHYSYDIHGNVKQLIQNITALQQWRRDTIRINYEYDLLCGNVNRVIYQLGKPEQWIQRFRYDADNRLTHAFSNYSQYGLFNSRLGERLDARYFYYPHGALARTEIGHKALQGIDYAQKLQGWLKLINNMDDIGKDAVRENPNAVFAQDAFNSILYYYPDDYRPVGNINYPYWRALDTTGLYDGNIAALSTAGIYSPMLKVFRYDKISRIKTMNTATLNAYREWNTPTDAYFTTYFYDFNGNLIHLLRFDGQQPMHLLNYEYTAGTNRMRQLISGITQNIPSSTYYYDPTGNLARDYGDTIAVEWNNAGKITTIYQGNNKVSFTYSPTGQRQSKITGNYADFYLHDATGNIMGIYRNSGDTLKLIEKPIYGSSRLGMVKQNITFLKGGTLFKKDTASIGLKNYEITDHLGNVTATFLDRKYFDSYANVFVPAVITITDYYPFGYPIPDRSKDLATYRFGFNGQEADNEVYGDKQSYTADFWQYDTRLGRRWNIDPKASEFPWISTYATFGNNPIWFVDPDGEKIVFAKGVSKEFKASFKAAIQKLNANKVGGIVSALEKSKRTYYITETTDGNNRFSPSSTTEGTIYWNPSLGAETDDGIMVSPTTILNHEMTHALTFDAAMDQGKVKEYIADSQKGSDPDYDTKNEKWVITRSEQKTAKALGEIGEGQVTRKNHKVKGYFPAESPTSNKPKTIELPEVKIIAE